MAKYHMLFTRDDPHGWGPQFGDHDKATVKDEMGDTYSGYAKDDLVILSLPNASQAHVDNAVRALNKYGRNIRV